MIFLICMYMHVHIYVGIHVSVHIRHLPWLLSTLFIGTGSLHWTWNSQIPTSSCHLPSGSHLCLPNAEVTWGHHAFVALYGFWESKLQSSCSHSGHAIPWTSSSAPSLILQGPVFHHAAHNGLKPAILLPHPPKAMNKGTHHTQLQRNESQKQGLYPERV